MVNTYVVPTNQTACKLLYGIDLRQKPLSRESDEISLDNEKSLLDHEIALWLAFHVYALYEWLRKSTLCLLQTLRTCHSTYGRFDCAGLYWKRLTSDATSQPCHEPSIASSDSHDGCPAAQRPRGAGVDCPVAC